MMQLPPMPFKILALAPFRLNEHSPWTQPPIAIENMDLDAAMDKLGISYYFPIPADLCPAGGLDINFSKIKDFHPDALIQNTCFLSHLLDAKNYLTATKTKKLSESEKKAGLKQWPDLPLIEIKSETKGSTPHSTRTVDSILELVALPEEDKDTSCQIRDESTQLDSILQKVLSHIFNHKEFRVSEAAWRGLKLLLQQSNKNPDIKFEIVPVRIDTLENTLNNLLTDLINNLPSLILIDLPFNNSPFSIKLLEKVAQFAETLLVPAMVCITPDFMQLSSWNELNKLPFIPHYLDKAAFAKWRKLTNQSATNWLAVTCNRFLVRYSYGAENKPRKFQFYEDLPLWINPVWAISCLIAQSFTKTGWPTRFSDWQNIRIDDLALHTEGSSKPIPTETSFSEDRIDQFRRAGIMALAAMPNKDIAFTSAQNTAGGTSLGYQLFVSRILQFVLWIRDHITKDVDGVELEKMLGQALTLFWGQSGHTGPDNMEISAGHPGPDNRIPLRIDLQPSKKILPSGEKIVLEFSW